MSLILSTSARDTLCNALVDSFDTGGGDGTMQFYTDGWGILLAEFDFSSTSFGSSVNGTASANTISNETSAVDTGTVGVFKFLDGTASDVLSGTVSATAGGDVNLNTTSITIGDELSISVLTITIPAS